MNRVVADFKADATGDKTIRLKDLRGTFRWYSPTYFVHKDDFVVHPELLT